MKKSLFSVGILIAFIIILSACSRTILPSQAASGKYRHGVVR